MEHPNVRIGDSREQRMKALVGCVFVIGVVSCALAWRDIARRSDEEVRGPKSMWRTIVTINPGNSIFYWLFGRK